MRDFCIFEDTPRLFLLGNRQFTFIAHNLDVAEDVVRSEERRVGKV